jgi:hypothetical protein
MFAARFCLRRSRDQFRNRRSQAVTARLQVRASCHDSLRAIQLPRDRIQPVVHIGLRAQPRHEDETGDRQPAGQAE